MKVACKHAYLKPLAPGKMLCSDCGTIVEVSKISPQKEAGLIVPPEIFDMSQAWWIEYRPWKLIPYKLVKQFKWYRSLLHGVEYLVMPIYEQDTMVSYSARKMWDSAPGLKYDVPKGRKRRVWFSSSSMALLGSYGNIREMVGSFKPLYVAEGIADAAYLSQLPAPKRWTIVMDGDVKGVEAAFRMQQEFKRLGVFPAVVILKPGDDPTDVPLPKLRKLIKEQTGGKK